MQISKSVDGEVSKTPLMGEHAFRLTGLSFGGSGGIMTTARMELPYLSCFQANTRNKSSQRGRCSGVL